MYGPGAPAPKTCPSYPGQNRFQGTSLAGHRRRNGFSPTAFNLVDTLRHCRNDPCYVCVRIGQEAGLLPPSFHTPDMPFGIRRLIQSTGSVAELPATKPAPCGRTRTSDRRRPCARRRRSPTCLPQRVAIASCQCRPRFGKEAPKWRFSFEMGWRAASSFESIATCTLSGP